MYRKPYKGIRLVPWHLTSKGHLRFKVMTPNESPYMVSYMSIIEMKSLSLVVFEIFVKMAFWPLDLGPRSNVMAPSESPYMVSYMSIIEMKSLSVVVFEIYAKIAFWPLDLGPRSKFMAPNDMTFHMCLQYFPYVYNRNENISGSSRVKGMRWATTTYYSFLPLVVSNLCTNFPKNPTITSWDFFTTNAQKNRQDRGDIFPPLWR